MYRMKMKRYVLCNDDWDDKNERWIFPDILNPGLKVILDEIQYMTIDAWYKNVFPVIKSNTNE